MAIFLLHYPQKYLREIAELLTHFIACTQTAIASALESALLTLTRVIRDAIPFAVS